VCLALAACQSDPAAPATGSLLRRSANAASADVTNDVAVPAQFPVRIPCSRAGWEIIVFQGTEHVLLQQVVRPDGGARVKIQTNGTGMTGVGLVTGDLYRVGGTTQESYDFPAGQPFPASYTYVNDFVVTSAGATGNVVAHETLRVIWDAYGIPTVQVVDFHADCH
jgi:hypothetical protein